MAEKIQVLIVDDLPETREMVRKLLQFEPDMEVVGQAANGQQAIELAKQHKPDIILMDINMPGVDGIAASQAILRLVPATQIIIMSVQSESDYLRRAMLAGARDFLMKPFSGDAITSAIRRVHESRPAPAAMPMQQAAPMPGQDSVRTTRMPSRLGKVITVFSPKGGSGTTTVAINLAVAMAEQGHRTILVDGSLQFGDVALMLNVKTVATLVDLADRLEEMDHELIDSIALSHSSGLKVLAAPPRPEMAELVTAEHMQRLLTMLRQYYEFVIIDTASDLSEVTLALLDAADRVLLVARQSLPSIKNASRFFDLTDEILNYEMDKTSLLVNAVSSRQGVPVKSIADALKRPVMATIPDDEAVDKAVDEGKPMVIGTYQKRPAAASLRKLAEDLAEEMGRDSQDEELSEDDQPKGLRRLFGR